jgi:hypothetical protein
VMSACGIFFASLVPVATCVSPAGHFDDRLIRQGQRALWGLLVIWEDLRGSQICPTI